VLELRISSHMNGICIVVRSPLTPHCWELMYVCREQSRGIDANDSAGRS